MSQYQQSRPPESFGSFLKGIKRYKSEHVKHDLARTSILQALAKIGEASMDQLRRESGLDFADFSEALTGLSNESLVRIAGRPGEEAVGLTLLGRKEAEALERGS